ncbi:MAG TPA: hypothetical protein VGW79_07080, partial [Actinomycetota bacterium]|nr:hypothetical protein [Actinomycetota bacterium]
MIGHLVMVRILVFHVLHKPVEDLHTSQIEGERRDLVAGIQCRVRFRTQHHHVREECANTRGGAITQHAVDPRDYGVDGRAGFLWRVGEQLDDRREHIPERGSKERAGGRGVAAFAGGPGRIAIDARRVEIGERNRIVGRTKRIEDSSEPTFDARPTIPVRRDVVGDDLGVLGEHQLVRGNTGTGGLVLAGRG